MEKYRIAFTVQDYYNYVGTSPCCSTKRRMLNSIPTLFKATGYNIKFKCIRNKFRIHMSVRMSEKEIKEVIDWYESTNFKLYNVSYKLITKHF